MDLSVAEAHQLAIKEHVIFLAFLFNRQVDRGDMLGDNWNQCLADVAVLADFYGSLPAVASRIEAAMLETGDIWKDIGYDPAFYLGLGSLIRSRLIFEDAMRHFVGQESFDFRGFHSSLPSRVKLLAQSKQIELLKAMATADYSLSNIDIGIKSPFWKRTLFSNESTQRQNARFLAKAVWLDWLAAHRGVRHSFPGCFGQWLTRLWESCQTDSISFLGRDVPERIMRAYPLKNHDRSVAEVTYTLHEYVRQAKRILEHGLFSPYTPKARHVRSCYLTRVAFSDFDLPWHEEEEWQCVEENEILPDASEAWLQQLGIGALFVK